MNRKNFLKLSCGSILVAVAANHAWASSNGVDSSQPSDTALFKVPLEADEMEILHLASLAPSGHNTQPWFVKYLKPYHYIIGNDKTRWLNAVDPSQRETILSIGAFLQNLEYAAHSFGYHYQERCLAKTNQDENIIEVTLEKSSTIISFDSQKIKNRRTVRTNYLSIEISAEDWAYLMNEEKEDIHFISKLSNEFNWLNEQTIEANKIQSYREEAQRELSNWIRFSNKEAEQHRDGLTPESMEIKGISAFVVKHFYDKENVMTTSFREQNIEQVKTQVAASGGWILITSKDSTVISLLETGKRMQRLLLKTRERNIAIHPMTQILEEKATQTKINKAIGISKPIQFILRVGYLKKYPEPVSLRRSVLNFTKI